MRNRIYLAFLAITSSLASTPAVRADHFKLELELKAGKTVKKAQTETAGPGIKPRVRGVLEAKAGQSITAKWTITSTAKNGTAKDVVVHFFVVKIDKVRQTESPKLDKDVSAESALSMDFKPKDASTGEMDIPIRAPGVYLVRLETIGAARGLTGHEHFAAIDLVVK
jgi:hypothetical protein